MDDGPEPALVVSLLQPLQQRGVGGVRLPAHSAHLRYHYIEYWMDNWTVSDITGHAGVIGQYLANAIISDKSK